MTTKLADHESITMGVDMMRRELEGHKQRLASAASDRRYTAEHRQDLIREGLKEAHSVAASHLARERGDIEVTRKAAEKALADARYVDPQLQAARAQVLSPIISTAAQNPDGLISAYVRRFGNLTDRILLQETAEAMIDAGVGGFAFVEKWQNATRNLELPEAEQEALEEIEGAEQAHEYLNAVEGLTDLELQQAASLPVEGIELMRAARLAATVHRYETTGTTALSGSGVIEVSGMGVE